VDEARLADFREWSEDVILSLNPLRTPEENERMMTGAAALDEYFSQLMAERRAAPRDDLVSDMVQLQARGEANVEDDEVRLNLQALLVGGNLTTTDLIGNGIWLLLTHPQQAEALRAHAPSARGTLTGALAAVRAVLEAQGVAHAKGGDWPAAEAAFAAAEVPSAATAVAAAAVVAASDPCAGAIEARLAAVGAARARGEATIPSSVELERATNLFVRASSPEQLAELRLSKDHWPS
jgi:hypothetical protein